MYYYHYLHQKYKDEDEEGIERNKDKFENPCLGFFNYIINCFS